MCVVLTCEEIQAHTADSLPSTSSLGKEVQWSSPFFVQDYLADTISDFAELCCHFFGPYFIPNAGDSQSVNDVSSQQCSCTSVFVSIQSQTKVVMVVMACDSCKGRQNLK